MTIFLVFVTRDGQSILVCIGPIITMIRYAFLYLSKDYCDAFTMTQLNNWSTLYLAV